MSVALIMGVLSTIQPLLAGTALGGVLSIATPAKIKAILRVVKIISGVVKPIQYTEEEKAIARSYADRRERNPSAYLATRDW